ncbi:hypothetical protein BDN70DRAFT_875128 [Pholiota conissans]|uniref:MYND-type domain-containing protein n=1 Tax=Pholiota conissans TaxID=109636 RepID=A0A9P5Z7Q6_9AGAR|nr:hypothetical protein BDN70DRAFT_875128 [Pholiota conissans]
MTELIIEAFTYGSNQTRAEVVLRPVIPEAIRGNLAALDAWAKELVSELGTDLKHTDVWTCEICGKPARETQYDMASWTRLAQPRIVLYIHHVCEAGANPCSTLLDRQSAQMAQMAGNAPDIKKRDKPADVQFPLSAGCLNCQDDKTAGPKLSRCGGCKLVRYVCGSECQKADWKRHKKICKMIKSAKFVDAV